MLLTDNFELPVLILKFIYFRLVKSLNYFRFLWLSVALEFLLLGSNLNKVSRINEKKFEFCFDLLTRDFNIAKYNFLWPS